MLRAFLLITALGLPALSLAQSAPRYYLGACASVFTDNLFHSGSYRSPTLVGPALTAGLVLGPRTALQISPALLWAHDVTTSDGYQPVSGNGTTSFYHRDYRVRLFSLPLLLRQTLISPGSRLRFDALADLLLLHADSRSSLASYTGGQLDYQYDFTGSDNTVSLSAGSALRYGLGRQVELVASAPINFLLGSNGGSFNNRILLHVLAGVHYTFGMR